MRILVFLAVLGSSAAAGAQSVTAPTPQAECFRSNPIDHVVVRMANGETRRGSLLCLGKEEFTLAEVNRVSRYPLSDVKRIRKAADPTWDGALKGASVALVVLAFCGRECPGEAIARTALGYGLLGLALDAIDTHTTTIFRAPAATRTAAAFRVRF